MSNHHTVPITHELPTHWSADAIELFNTSEYPLPWRFDETEVYAAGDDVIVTSRDGATFIGHIVEVEDTLLWVTLD